MTFFRRAALALLASLLILALPAAASAAVYTVNSTEDLDKTEPGVECPAVAVDAECTLRAAMELSNESTSVDDEIVFSSDFDGEVADSTIVPFFLPDIEDTVTIDGRCEPDPGVVVPCVGVSGESRFEVKAPGVEIDGLAISEFQIGIAVEAEEFEAHGNWIGFEVDGTEGAGEQPYGIFVAPHADKAVIGGTTPADRNVFGNTNSGLILRGASSGTVLGNYFGVEPDGTTPALNGRDLVIADKKEALDSVPATDNQVGADVGNPGAGTSACDLGCNVFASGGFGNLAAIDLQGTELEEELPATGPTLIEGNYIGIDAEGDAFAEAAPSGIRVGSADGVTIGGPEPGQANQIHGGTYGVFAGNGGNPALALTVEGNRIGRSLDDSAGLAPPSTGIAASSGGITEVADTAEFVDNSVEASQVGIENHSTGAVIAGNSITGGETGIRAWGDTEGSGIGNLIEENVIADPADNGILIENDFNEIFANEISGAGESGIAIKPFLTLGADD
ncbi:MAG: NosD domain-containing protein, partial [Solirubrobacterales bacterium]